MGLTNVLPSHVHGTEFLMASAHLRKLVCTFRFGMLKHLAEEGKLQPLIDRARAGMPNTGPQ